MRAWRMMWANPFGNLMWFDPACEHVRLYAMDPGECSGVEAPMRGDEPDENVQVSIFPEGSPHGC